MRASGRFLISARRRSNSTPSPMHNVQLRRSLQLYAYYMGIIYPPLIVICFWCAPAEAITANLFWVFLNAVLIGAVIGEICSLSKIEKNRQKRQLNLKGIIVSSIITRKAFNAKRVSHQGRRCENRQSAADHPTLLVLLDHFMYAPLPLSAFLSLPPKKGLLVNTCWKLAVCMT